MRQGCLGTEEQFAYDIVRPIEKGRLADASSADKVEEEYAVEVLSRTVNALMLRRTSEVLANTLPTKHTLIVGCRPTQTQRGVHGALEARAMRPLVRLNNMRANLTWPGLLHGASRVAGLALSEVVTRLPDQPVNRASLSGKMIVCCELIKNIVETTEDRVLVIADRIEVIQLILSYVRGLTDSQASAECIIGSTQEKARRALEVGMDAVVCQPRASGVPAACQPGRASSLMGVRADPCVCAAEAVQQGGWAVLAARRVLDRSIGRGYDSDRRVAPYPDRALLLPPYRDAEDGACASTRPDQGLLGLQAHHVRLLRGDDHGVSPKPLVCVYANARLAW